MLFKEKLESDPSSLGAALLHEVLLLPNKLLLVVHLDVLLGGRYLSMSKELLCGDDVLRVPVEVSGGSSAEIMALDDLAV